MQYLFKFAGILPTFCLLSLTSVHVSYIFDRDVWSRFNFQAGLIQLLYTRFRMTLVLCIIYMILSISLHTWHITVHWSAPLKHYWTKEFHTLYSAHRTGTSENLERHLVVESMIVTQSFYEVAVLYYYFYKRASLRIGDPRFYKGSTWVQKQLSIP